MSNPNTISLKGRFIGKEAKVGVAITPGMLVERYSGGLRPHSTAGARAQAAFARENEMIGKGISTAYAIGDRGLYGVYERGAEVYGLLAISAVAVPAFGLLESAGDGTLRLITVGDEADLTGTLTGTVGGALNDVPNPTDTPASADVLRDDLVATVLPVINDNFKELQAKVNAMLPEVLARAVGIALEAVDNSAGAALARIRVELF